MLDTSIFATSTLSTVFEFLPFTYGTLDYILQLATYSAIFLLMLYLFKKFI